MKVTDYEKLRASLVKDARAVIKSFAAGKSNKDVYAVAFFFSHQGRVDVAINTEAAYRRSSGGDEDADDDPESERYEASEFAFLFEGDDALSSSTRALLTRHAEALADAGPGEDDEDDDDGKPPATGTYLWLARRMKEAIVAATKDLAADPSLAALRRTDRCVVYAVEQEAGVDAALMREVIPARQWRKLFPDFD